MSSGGAAATFTVQQQQRRRRPRCSCSSAVRWGVGASSLWRWLALVVLVLGPFRPQSSPVALAQSCVPWNGQPSFCAQFEPWTAPTTMIYVPENTELLETEKLVSNAALHPSFAEQAEDEADEECALMRLKLLCATQLRPCITVDGLAPDGATIEKTSIPVPLQPCEYLCILYVSQCTNLMNDLKKTIGEDLYFPPNESAPLTCNEMDATGLPLYAPTNYTVPYDVSQTFEARAGQDDVHLVRCNDVKQKSSMEHSAACVPPLKALPSGQCAFTCPLPTLTDEQFNHAIILQLTLGWLSWLGSLILVLTYALHPQLRQFPSNLVPMTAVAAHIAALAIVLPTFVGHERIWCGNPDEPTKLFLPDVEIANSTLALVYEIEDLTMRSGLCTFQGWLLQFGFLSSTMWWGIISLHMFASVFFGKRLPSDSTKWRMGVQVVFHICGWLIPAIFMVIPAIAGKFSFAPGSTFCTILRGDTYFFICWGLPVGFILTVGSFLFVCSLLRLLWLGHKLSQLHKVCRTYLRLILFIALFLAIYVFVFSFSLRVFSQQATIEKGYTAYLLCLSRRGRATTAVTGGEGDASTDEEDGDCSLSSDIHNFPLVVLRCVGYSSLGFLLCLMFCVSSNTASVWWQVAKALKRGDWSAVAGRTIDNNLHHPHPHHHPHHHHGNGKRKGSSSSSSSSSSSAKTTVAISGIDALGVSASGDDEDADDYELGNEDTMELGTGEEGQGEGMTVYTEERKEKVGQSRGEEVSREDEAGDNTSLAQSLASSSAELALSYVDE